MKKESPSREPVALSPRQFAELFGKEQSWGYRQIYSGKVKTITAYGRILIPASEVEKILGEADRYNGRKPKAKKASQPSPLEKWKALNKQQRTDSPAGRVSGFGNAPSGSKTSRLARARSGR